MKRAFSLTEVIVSLSLLSMLLLLMTTLYIYSLRSSAQSYRQMDELSEVQAVAFRLATDIEPAAYRSVSFEGSSLFALLNAASASHSLELDSAGHVAWQRYLLYGWKSAEQELWRYEVPLPAGTTFPDGLVTLNAWDGGSGPHPLSFYQATPTGPARKLASFISEWHAEKPSARLVNVRFTVARPNKPAQHFECTWRVHN